jgi:hypothetical protein
MKSFPVERLYIVVVEEGFRLLQTFDRHFNRDLDIAFASMPFLV